MSSGSWRAIGDVTKVEKLVGVAFQHENCPTSEPKATRRDLRFGSFELTPASSWATVDYTLVACRVEIKATPSQLLLDLQV